MESSSGDAGAAAPAGDPDPASVVDEGATPGEAGTAEPVVDERDELTGDDAAQPGDDGPAGPTRRGAVWRWLAAGTLAVVLAGAGYEGWLLFGHHQTEVAAAQALEAAKEYTVVLTGVDPGAIDQNFADVLDGATGEFKQMYAQSSEQLRRLLIENKAAAHGTVIDAAVKSATKNRVEVMLFVDQSVSNAASPGPQIDRSRILMTMEKVNGRWLAGKVDMP